MSNDDPFHITQCVNDDFERLLSCVPQTQDSSGHTVKRENFDEEVGCHLPASFSSKLVGQNNNNSSPVHPLVQKLAVPPTARYRT